MRAERPIWVVGFIPALEYTYNYLATIGRHVNEIVAGYRKFIKKLHFFKDIVDLFFFRAGGNMPSKYLNKCFSFMVRLTLCIHLAVCIIKKCKNICGTISNIFKSLNAFFLIVCLNVGKESFEYLNAGTLIKKEKVFRRDLI